jgi:hypothetical protein
MYLTYHKRKMYFAIDTYYIVTDEIVQFQLAANSNITLHAGFPDIRWSQTAKYGYVPNPRLPNVFMAVAMDLPDYNSTRGTYVKTPYFTFQYHSRI